MLKLRLYFLTVWSIFDPIYFSFTRLKFIEKHGVFRVRLTRYKGKTIHLSDGTIINKNDLLVKIHLHNVRLIKEMNHIDSDIRKALYIFKQVEKSLPSLANYVKNHPKYEQIQGIIGISGLNKGTSRLGFENFKIQNQLYRRYKHMIFLAIYLLTSKSQKIKRSPEYLFMSKNVLLKNY